MDRFFYLLQKIPKMRYNTILKNRITPCLAALFTLLLIACEDRSGAKTIKNTPKKPVKRQSTTTEKTPPKPFAPRLDDKNAIPFLQQYGAKNPESKVRLKTRFGNIDIQLYENTPYHRANFVFLIKEKYFDGTMFHRVVPGFIIQGGNSDSNKVMQRRTRIGRYLLPPDTRKGHRHHRGVISMPSSAIDNPHKLASPYEFFIVQQAPGAYHLDGNYTAFGEVIAGMDVVNKINAVPIDKREMPLHNVIIRAELLE